MARTCQGLVPSKFTRAYLPPDFKVGCRTRKACLLTQSGCVQNEEKIMDRSYLQRVALGRVKSPSKQHNTLRDSFL